MTILKPLYLLLFGLLTLLASAQASLGKGYRTIALDSTYEHTKWGIGPLDLAFHFAAYTCSFDSEDDNNGDSIPERWGIPEWVAYEIKAKKPNTEDPVYSRPAWMTVDSLYERGIIPKDETYHIKGTRELAEVKTNYRFVRGHLCPKETADRLGMNAGWNTHTFLNAVPQLQWQNNGLWKKLEADILDWADTYGRVWVVTGPIFFDKSPSLWLGQAGEIPAAVPDALFKIVIRQANNNTGLESLCFVIPNVLPADKDYPEYLCSMQHVADLSGLNFLTAIDPNAKALEYQKGENLSQAQKQARLAAW